MMRWDVGEVPVDKICDTVCTPACQFCRPACVRACMSIPLLSHFYLSIPFAFGEILFSFLFFFFLFSRNIQSPHDTRTHTFTRMWAEFIAYFEHHIKYWWPDGGQWTSSYIILFCLFTLLRHEIPSNGLCSRHRQKPRSGRVNRDRHTQTHWNGVKLLHRDGNISSSIPYSLSQITHYTLTFALAYFLPSPHLSSCLSESMCISSWHSAPAALRFLLSASEKYSIVCDASRQISIVWRSRIDMWHAVTDEPIYR